MLIEVLVVENCPGEAPTRDLVRRVCAAAGAPNTPVVTTVIRTLEQARRRGFVGSPTVLVDGVDPHHDDTLDPALACRVYRGPAGSSGLPDEAVLRAAVRHARPDRSAPPAGGPTP
ncbi:hypothetical protein GCM10027047_39430 [Rhodococcus aerolatus]